MKKAPLISVVLPIYNVGKYLAQCLESLIYQTYKNLEIIAVDDGSPDDSIDILRAYARRDKRIKIIRQKNAGVSAARNAGIKAARGDFVGFVDPDDYVSLDYYERLLGAALAVGADMAVADFTTLGGPLSIKFDAPAVWATTEEKFRATKALPHGQCWRYLFRRAFLAGRRFPEDRAAYEDAPFVWDAVAAANRIATAPGAEYFYFKRAGGAISRASRAERARFRRERDAFARAHNLRGASDDKSAWSVRLFDILPIMRISGKRASGQSHIKIFGIELLAIKKK
ncbi:MAG: glycosyltransferase [Rickettsiales bacterium]|jgi:glycosyltransferase EpsJ|nr:glycosyltransferase [Rickettsiales bacterium]